MLAPFRQRLAWHVGRRSWLTRACASLDSQQGAPVVSTVQNMCSYVNPAAQYRSSFWGKTGRLLTGHRDKPLYVCRGACLMALSSFMFHTAHKLGSIAFKGAIQTDSTLSLLLDFSNRSAFPLCTYCTTHPNAACLGARISASGKTRRSACLPRGCRALGQPATRTQTRTQGAPKVTQDN